MAIEIVDFPINSMVIFHSYVKSPEGKSIGSSPKNEVKTPAETHGENFRAHSGSPGALNVEHRCLCS